MKKELLKKLIAEPDRKHKVSDFDPGFTSDISKKAADEELRKTIDKMAKLQSKLYAFDRYSMLVIFQAMDAAGKDGTIKHVLSGIDPQGFQTVSFKTPTHEQLDHDYLWRVFKNLPEKGRIGVFNRSHYEEVIVTKVHPEIILGQKLVNVDKPEDIDEKFWKRRYRQINDFERHLTENGVVVLKFFLNVSQDEQERRFRDRLRDEDENWKFSLADYKESMLWNEYMEAYSDMLSATSTEHAPWYVIPADHKWFMRWAVAEIICDRMKALKLKYPELTEAKKKEMEETMAMIDNYFSGK